MNQIRMKISGGIAKLLQKKNVKHFRMRKDFTFDDSSRQDYMNHFQLVQFVESQELEIKDR